MIFSRLTPAHAGGFMLPLATRASDVLFSSPAFTLSLEFATHETTVRKNLDPANPKVVKQTYSLERPKRLSLRRTPSQEVEFSSNRAHSFDLVVFRSR